MNLASTASAGCILVAGQRRWRVAAVDVLDVVPWPKLTAIPLHRRSGYPELLGIFEWNSAVVPVFEIDDLPPEERRCVVIVRARVNASQAPLGIAATQVASSDAAATAEALAIAELSARLPQVRR